MIKYETGSIFDEVTDVIVCPVNCVGAMGAGLAKEFKERYPKNYIAYKNACAQHLVQPGQIFIYEISNIRPPYYIFNLPTKRHFEDDSLVEDIDAGIEQMVRTMVLMELNSVAIPPLGCGLGGLDYWKEVWPLLTKHCWTNALMDREFVFMVNKKKSEAYFHERQAALNSTSDKNEK